MNRLFLVPLAALTLTSVSLSTPSSAAPRDESNKELKDLCEFLISEEYPGFGINLGECMSYYLVSEEGFKTKRCDFLEETGQFPEEGYSKYSQCVRMYPYSENFPPP